MAMLRRLALSLFALPVLLPACAADLADGDDDEYEEEPTGSTEDAIRSGVSCRERPVTGYRKGAPFAMKVIEIGGVQTAKPTAHAFLKFQAAADKAGVRLTINSGFRSNEKQAYLYNCYKTKKCNNGNLAARPGYSNHQNGVALDLATSNWSWVAKNASKYGFRATVPSERWHYEFSGSDPGGPCSGAAGGAAADDDTASDGPADPESGCYSATLAKNVAEGACVQSSSTELFYQCHDGKWYRGVENGVGQYGSCTSMHPISN